MLEILIIAGFALLLVIQLYVLMRIRKTMVHVAHYLKLVNMIFKEMVKTHESTVATIKENQQAINTSALNAIRTNQKKNCQICKFRQSFIKVENDKIAFTYQCGLTKDEVALSFYCKKFEYDMESSKSGN
ncbi:hypothetical protein HUU42_15905 [bacterium]|nr:hypothetical protein [bacterium]